MVKGPGDSWYYNETYDDSGNYQFQIIAVDNSDYKNDSESGKKSFYVNRKYTDYNGFRGCPVIPGKMLKITADFQHFNPESGLDSRFSPE